MAGGPDGDRVVEAIDESMASARPLSVTGTLRGVVTDRADQRYTVPSHVLSRSVGDDTVLLDLHQDEYFSLGQVGTKIWALIAEGEAFGSIVDQVADAYDVDRNRVEADVAALVDDLVGSGIILEG